jgi:hypothetical protein
LSSSTFRKKLDCYESPTWQQLFDHSKRFYDELTSRYGAELLTRPTDGRPGAGSRLVATLCFAYEAPPE